MKNNYRLLIHRCRTFLFLIFFFTVVVVNIFSVFLNVSFRFSCSCSPTSTSTGSIIIPTPASFTSGWRRCLVFKFSHINIVLFRWCISSSKYSCWGVITSSSTLSSTEFHRRIIIRRQLFHVITVICHRQEQTRKFARIPLVLWF